MKRTFIVYTLALIIAGGILGFIIGTNCKADAQSEPVKEPTQKVIFVDNSKTDAEKEFDFEEALTSEIRSREEAKYNMEHDIY